MIIFIIAAIIITAAFRKTDVFGEFTAGAKDNLAVCADILPTLIGLITAVGMFRASGAAVLLTDAFSGILSELGFPCECLPLALIRPVSGSGALAVFESVIKEYHPDSFAGRAASIIIGSGETTFYTMTVYFSAVKIKNTKHTLAASLTGDIAGMIFSILAVNLIFGNC